LAFALLIFLLLTLTLSRFDGWNLLESVKQIPLWSVALLLVLQIVTQLLVNFQWYKIAQLADTPVSFRNMFLINCQGAVIDSITPGVKFGGEVTRGVQISRMGNCSGEQAAALVAMQKLFSLGAFFLINLFVIGNIVSGAEFLTAIYLQIAVYAILLFFLLLFLIIFFMPRQLKIYLQKKPSPRFSWMLRTRIFFLTLFDQVIAVRKNTKVCAALFLLSLLIWLIYPAKMYLLAVQVFPAAPVMYTGAVTFASYMVAMIPVFPGGLGGFEGTMTGLLLTMGLMQSDAYVITVLFRFVTFWFVMLFSIVYIVCHKMINKSTIS